jgi:hypothetical protein
MHNHPLGRLEVLIVMAMLTLLSACESPSPAKFSSSGSACPTQQRIWTDAHLTELAINEVERRGGHVDRGRAEIRFGQEACKLVVVVSEVPARPGGHFSVIVSAENGKVLEFVPGL